MHLQGCEHPVKVYNKYIHEWLLVPCRKCNTCLVTHQKRWVAKLEVERRCWKYCFMIFLSYDDEHLPKMYLNTSGTQLVLKERDGLCHEPVDIKDLHFDTAKDKEYFDARVSHDLGLPVCSVRDIQLFKKRLNKIIHDKITKSYKNLRSFICAEYGPVTQRPHYHGVVFFEDDRIASSINQLLSEAWHYGISNAKYVEASACSYVASYVNSFGNLPSFYEHTKLRPFYLFSKQPPLGSLVVPQEETLSKFMECNPLRVVPAKAGEPFVAVRNVSSFENRLYPRIKEYSKLSSTSRVGLYRFLSSKDWSFEEWCQFFHFVGRHDRHEVLSKFGVACDTISNLCSYFKDFYACTGDDNFNQNFYEAFKLHRYTSLNTLYALYSISNRIAVQSRLFGLTLEQYDYYIDKYWSNVELYKLRKFYEFQSDYSFSHRGESLRLMYPNISTRDIKVPPIEKTEDFISMVSQSKTKFEKTQKTKDKNAYFSSKKFTDKKLKKIVSDYYGSEYFV